MLGAKTGKGWSLPAIALVDLYIIWIITSLPGLAISPIMGKLTTIFPHVSHLEIQMLTIGPPLAAIPFIFFGGALATKCNNIKLFNITCICYAAAGALCLVATEMWQLIGLSFIVGIGAGILSPLSVVFLSNIFVGKYRSKQFGLTSAILNLALVACVASVGYIAEVNWRLPFLLYCVPIIPVLLTPIFKKYVVEPKDSDQSREKVKFVFSKQCNVPALIRYCLFYAFITFVISSISLYLPFLMKTYGYKSGMTGDLTSIVYAGMFLSGMILNRLLKIFKSTTFDMILLAIAISFVLLLITKNPIIIGIGIFIASFFYGIGQPYAYNKTSLISTPIASSLAMAYFISMNSVGEVSYPFINDWVGDIFHLNSDPTFPFLFCLVLTIAAWLIVLIRRLILQGKAKEKADLAAVTNAGKTIDVKNVQTDNEKSDTSSSDSSATPSNSNK